MKKRADSRNDGLEEKWDFGAFSDVIAWDYADGCGGKAWDGRQLARVV